MATWQAPRSQKGQEEAKSRMEPSKAPPAFSFLPLLRMAFLIQGIDYYGNRRIALEGGQWRCCYGAGEFVFHKQFWKIAYPSQSAGSSQTTDESHWILQAGLVFIMICPLCDFRLSMSCPLLELCFFFPLLD